MVDKVEGFIRICYEKGESDVSRYVKGNSNKYFTSVAINRYTIFNPEGGFEIEKVEGLGKVLVASDKCFMRVSKEIFIKSMLKDCTEHFEHNEKLDFSCIGYEVVEVNKRNEKMGKI